MEDAGSVQAADPDTSRAPSHSLQALASPLSLQRSPLQPLGEGWPAWEGACVWGAARRAPGVARRDG